MSPFRTPRLLTRTALGLGLVAALAAPGAFAQSIEELYQAALTYDAAYLGAISVSNAAEYKREQSYALRRPSVAALLQGNRRLSDPIVAPTGSGDNSYSNVADAQLTGRQPLYNRTNRATIDQAEKAFELSASDLQIAGQDLIVRLSSAYFDVLVAIETLNTTRASKAAIAEQLASAKRNFEVGTATITDTREAQSRFDLARAREIQAENDLRTKRVALDQMVGRSNVNPKPLAVPVVLPPTIPGDLDTWVTTADEVHPSVRKARLAMDIAQLETEKARAGHLPTVDLVGSYTQSHLSGVAGAGPIGLGPNVTGPYANGQIGVQLNLPLYAGNSVQNRIRETLALEEKARNDLEAARRAVAQATRQSFIGVQSLEAEVKALEAAEESSKLALEATELGYRVGVRVNVDVLNAQSQLYATRRDLAKARYDVLLAALKLRLASGTLRGSDLTIVNRMLVP